MLRPFDTIRPNDPAVVLVTPSLDALANLEIVMYRADGGSAPTLTMSDYYRCGFDATTWSGFHHRRGGRSRDGGPVVIGNIEWFFGIVKGNVDFGDEYACRKILRTIVKRYRHTLLDALRVVRRQTQRRAPR